MTEYFVSHFVKMSYGYTYIITQAAYAISIVLLFNDVKFTRKGILSKAAEMILATGILIFSNGLLYMWIGSTWKDWLQMLVFIVGYAAVRSRYKIGTRIVFVSVFYICTFLNVVISEPWGDILMSYGYNGWGNLWSSSLVSALLFFFLVWYLKRFSTDKLLFTPKFGIALMVAISAMAGVSQVAYDTVVAGRYVPDTLRMYGVAVSGIFWVLEIIAYYMFYVIAKEYGGNLELLSMQRKAEADREMYVATKAIYEEMSAMRHEMKNHDTYMRALLEKGEYKKMGEYLMSSQTDSSEFYQYVNCGNLVVNTIVNYEASAAKAHGITLRTAITVPSELPVRETELCSLLFNLLNNAIEACETVPAQEDLSISLEIRQKGSYLFIRVKNPVDDSSPAKERLKLVSTKQNKKVHGYGTKVVKLIVEKYNGSVKYTMEDGIFTADVMLETCM